MNPNGENNTPDFSIAKNKPGKVSNLQKRKPPNCRYGYDSTRKLKKLGLTIGWQLHQ